MPELVFLQVNLRFADSIRKPGENTRIIITAAPGSQVALAAVDKSVYLLKGGNQLTTDYVSCLILYWPLEWDRHRTNDLSTDSSKSIYERMTRQLTIFFNKRPFSCDNRVIEMHQWYLFILWIIESTNEIIFSLMNSLVRWWLDGNAWPAWTVTTVLFRTTLTRTIMLNLLTPGFKPFIVKPVLIGHPRDSRDCWTGPSCSNVGQRYSPDKSLSGGYVLGVYPVDRVIQFSNNSTQNCKFLFWMFICLGQGNILLGENNPVVSYLRTHYASPTLLSSYVNGTYS